MEATFEGCHQGPVSLRLWGDSLSRAIALDPHPGIFLTKPGEVYSEPQGEAKPRQQRLEGSFG